MLQAVAFDLDETLAVTDSDRSAILRRAAERAGVPLTFDRRDYREAHRDHSGTEDRLPVFEALVDGDAEIMTRAYREAVGEALEPVPNAAETLATLREGYRVGLLTDGPVETQRDKLRRLGWTDAFDAVVVTGEVDAPKPDPVGFATLCDALGTPPRETAYVGNDPERDVAGAVRAGLRPVQVIYDDGPDEHPAAVASIERSDFAALPDILEATVGDGTNDA